jgi:hypothetical protein
MAGQSRHEHSIPYQSNLAESVLFLSSTGLFQLVQFHRSVLTREGQRLSLAALLRDATDAVITAVVGRQLPALLDQQATLPGKERVENPVLRPARGRLAEIVRLPVIGFMDSIGFIGSIYGFSYL